MFSLFPNSKTNPTTPAVDTIVAGGPGQTLELSKIHSTDLATMSKSEVSGMSTENLMAIIMAMGTKLDELETKVNFSSAAKAAKQATWCQDDDDWRRIPALFFSKLEFEPLFKQIDTLDYSYVSASTICYKAFNEISSKNSIFDECVQSKAGREVLSSFFPANHDNDLLPFLFTTRYSIFSGDKIYSTAKYPGDSIEKLKTDYDSRDFLCKENLQNDVISHAYNLERYIDHQLSFTLKADANHPDLIVMERCMLKAAILIGYYQVTLKQLKGEVRTGTHAWYEINPRAIEEHQKKRNIRSGFDIYKKFFLDMTSFCQLKHSTQSGAPTGVYKKLIRTNTALVENIVKSLTFVE